MQVIILSLVSLNKNDEQGMMYPALWQSQLLHKNNPVNFGDFGIVLASNFAFTNKFLNFCGCCVVRSIFYH